MEQSKVIEILERHYKLADLVNNHGYFPQGSHAATNELAALHKELKFGAVDMYCGACIFRMFKRLYAYLETILSKPEEVKEEKQTFPKHEKKKKK